MGRFNAFTGDYDPTWEDTAGSQIEKMQDMSGRDYFEVWYDPDEYLVGEPKVKLYDSYHNDDSALVDATGKTISEFKGCVIPRAGCAYSLSPEFYEERTGTEFPDYVGDDSAVIVIVFSGGWFDQHYN